MPENSPTTQRSLNVFLCHSSGDKPAVRGLYQRLRGDGLTPWLDEEDILPGQPWEETIRKAVRQSDAVIVCLSRSSINKTGFVQKEIRFALDIADEQPEGKVFIIPVRLEACNVPERLSRWQWVNLFEENGYEKLLRGLRACAKENHVASLPLVVPTLAPKVAWFQETEKVSVEPTGIPRQTLSVRTGRLEKITIGGIDFVEVPAGKFVMGSRDDNPTALDREKPQHTIKLADYFIARTPVTNRQFKEFLDETQRKHQWVKGWQKKLDHPVVNVSWEDAMAFCRWLNDWHAAELPSDMALTLPSEAEWEKAARGEFGREYPWGDEFDAERCNTHEGGKGDTTPVGVYSPQGDSPYGAVDMAGNVWEWCVDWYFDDEYQRKVDLKQPIVNPRGPETGVMRVVRGGSWLNDRNYARCAYRNLNSPVNYDDDLGFRVVFSPKSI